jgi:glycosyltransferase involved in cell wall biosynthesis
MVKISIIVPIYNVQDYIERCLDSIICQECDDFALECIIVNDCTPDDSIHIVRRKLVDYTGRIDFRILNHQTNEGLSAARNTGIQSSSGDFVFFMDSDDRLECGAIKSLVDSFNSVDDISQVDVVMGNSFLCKNGKQAMAFEKDLPVLFDNSDETALKNLLNRNILHTAWNKLIRLDFLLKHNIYFEKGIIDEDLLWSYLIFLYARSVLVVPHVTYIYEDNPSSIMNTASSRVARVIKSRIVICNTILACPPKYSFIEYYVYLFYVMSRAINLFELNKNDSLVSELADGLIKLRDGFLSEVKKKHFYLLYLFFLTSKKPYYKISNCKLYRRYYDKIAMVMVTISNYCVWKR